MEGDEGMKKRRKKERKREGRKKKVKLEQQAFEIGGSHMHAEGEQGGLKLD